MKSNLNIFLSKLILLCFCIHLNLFSYSTESLKLYKNISEYSHRSWDSKNGFLPYSINIILQTRDGYLWIGTNSNLSYISLDEIPKQTFSGEQSIPKISDIDFSIYYATSLVCDNTGAVWAVAKSTSYIVRISPGNKKKK